MNRNETLAILAHLQDVYSDTSQNISEDSLNARISEWEFQFKDNSFKEVWSAVEKHIATSTSHFMPVPGEIKAIIHAEEEMSELEALARIRKACSNGRYGAEVEFRKLPPILQKLVVSPAQIRKWSDEKEDEFTKIASYIIIPEFRRLQKREHDNALIPAEVRAVSQGTSDNIAIGEKPEVHSLPEHSIAEKLIAQKQAEADRLDESRKDLRNRTDEEIAVSRKENMAKLESRIKEKDKAGG